MLEPIAIFLVAVVAVSVVLILLETLGARHDARRKQ